MPFTSPTTPVPPVMKPSEALVKVYAPVVLFHWSWLPALSIKQVSKEKATVTAGDCGPARRAARFGPDVPRAIARTPRLTAAMLNTLDILISPSVFARANLHVLGIVFSAYSPRSLLHRSEARRILHTFSPSSHAPAQQRPQLEQIVLEHIPAGSCLRGRFAQRDVVIISDYHDPGVRIGR